MNVPDKEYRFSLNRALEVLQQFEALRESHAWQEEIWEAYHAARLGNLWRVHIERVALDVVNHRITEEFSARVRERTLDGLALPANDEMLGELMIVGDWTRSANQPLVNTALYEAAAECQDVDAFRRFITAFVQEMLDVLLNAAQGSPAAADQFHALERLWQRWNKSMARFPRSLEGASNEIDRELMTWLKRHPKDVTRVGWSAVERIVGEILSSRGFSVELTGRSRGRSADVIAIRTDELGVDTRYLIEVKAYRKDKRISLGIVNQVIGAAKREQVDHAFLVTTARFTSDVEQQRARLGELRLHLRDAAALEEWLSAYVPHDAGGLWLDARWRYDVFPRQPTRSAS